MKPLLLLALTIAAESAEESLARLKANLASMKAKPVEYKNPPFEPILSLKTDATALLKQMPYVAEVTVSKPKGMPNRRIIHFLDWHLVPREDCAADLANARGKLTDAELDAELDAEHEIHMLEVELVQAERTATFRALAQWHALREVRFEGLTPEDMELLPICLKAHQSLGNRLENLAKTRDKLSPEAQQGVDELEAYAKSHRSTHGQACDLHPSATSTPFSSTNALIGNTTQRPFLRYRQFPMASDSSAQ